MNFEIQATSYFDVEAKRLAKRHRSFIDDLQDFRESLLKNPYQVITCSSHTVPLWRPPVTHQRSQELGNFR